MSDLADSVKKHTAIVLVPGSFCPPTFYTKVTRILGSNGFTSVHESRLLSADSKDDQKQPPPKLEDDALYIHDVLQKLISQGLDVVLVMNSYGGFPGTEALKGLPNRGKLVGEVASGQSGAVVGLVYLGSFLPFPGDSLRSVMGDYLFEPLKTGDPGNYMYLPDESGPGIFSDWAAEGESRDEDVKHWFGNMITHSSDSFDGKVSYDLWAEGVFQGKVVYVLGENDLVVPPALAESMIQKVQSQAGQARVEVKRIEKGGHVMHVTKPDVIVQVVKDLLKGLAQ